MLVSSWWTMSNAIIYRSLGWCKKPCNAATRFAIKGPSWLPISVRRVPLRVLAFVVDWQVRILAKVLGVSGS